MSQKISKKVSRIIHANTLTCHLMLGVVAVAVYVFIMPLMVHAEAFISQSYATNDKLSLGSLVAVENNSNSHVIAATSANVDNLLGVIINGINSPLSLRSDEDNQVQVGTTGVLQVLVSNINGAIAQGDYITASPIKGVGMKATGNVRVIGVAQGDINMSGKEQTYTDKDGKKQTVKVGQIPVLVDVAYYFKEPDKTIIPSALQNVANALAGKSVSTTPIIISAAIFLITLIVVASIIYSMIRSSIISVGRNPMAQSAVYRDVIQLSALVLGILGVALISIYLVLTRL